MIPKDHAGDTRHEKIARRYTHQVDDRTSTMIKDLLAGGHRARKSSSCGRSVEYWAKIDQRVHAGSVDQKRCESGYPTVPQAGRDIATLGCDTADTHATGEAS